MVTNRIFLLPVAVFILLPATFIISYVISVVLGHVEPDFPYISDTGTYSPESCIFGQLLNFSAFLVAATIYTRYKQVHTYYLHHMSGDLIPQLNRAALVLGLVAALGLSIVANFQETNLLTVHLIGALLCFGPGTLYIWLQTALSFLVAPIINKRPMAFVRLAISFTCTIAFLTSCVAGPMSMSQFHGKDKTKWYPKDGGFELHVLSTVAEWILAISFNAFILTYVREFKRITVASPQVYLAFEELRAPLTADDSLAAGDATDVTYDGTGVQTTQPPFRELLA